MKAQLASVTTRAVNAASRRLGRGQGTVAGGRAGLRLDRRLLEHLSAGRLVVLVSGTNGKTTTTRLATVGLGVGGEVVVSNETGSNMPPGHVAALAGTDAPRAVLEVDEAYLPRVLTATAAAAVVLLNLSRDQLDRSNEVRMVAGRWRAALAAAPHTHVIANADDPLVVWGAGVARTVHWVGAGLRWQLDAVGCPSCEERITFGEGAWSCASCGFARPEPEVSLVPGPDGTACAVWADGRKHPVALLLPGRFNLANALMAAVACEACGVDAAAALDAMASVHEVAGRFTVRSFGDVRARLMLAKNPAGWTELLDLVAGADTPLVISINATRRGRHRSELAVGRPLRAPCRAVRRGDRGALPRPVRAAALRRRRACLRGRPGGGDTPRGAGCRCSHAWHGRRHRELHGLPRSVAGAQMSSVLRVAVVYPDLLGTYGDGGNGLILARRAEWRGRPVELLQAVSDRPLPAADVYCLGGGEDGPQVRAARTLIDDGTLARRVADGAVVLAVCAGFQVVGRTFPGADGSPHEGLGLLEVDTVKGEGARAVGEVLVEPTGIEDLPTLTGFENHGGRTMLAEGATPLGRVAVGVGNGGGDHSEGAVNGRIVGTYLHGPVLARNPALADTLLQWALGDVVLTPIDDVTSERLRDERFGAVRRRRRLRRAS